MDDEWVERQKEGDSGPSVVVAPVEVDAGEQVAAHVAARQQGVEHPEGENLQHRSDHRFSQMFFVTAAQLQHWAKPFSAVILLIQRLTIVPSQLGGEAARFLITLTRSPQVQLKPKFLFQKSN